MDECPVMLSTSFHTLLRHCRSRHMVRVSHAGGVALHPAIGEQHTDWHATMPHYRF